MVLKINKVLVMIMAVMIFISASPYESFAAGSVSTSISGGGTYEQGDKVTIRFSFTGPEEGRLAGVVSSLAFNPEVLRFESMGSSSNTSILAPGVYEGITIHNLQNRELINNNGGFTSGIYNDGGVTTLGATVTFEVIRPGDATVTVRSTHAGNLSLERLGNSSASASISATEAKEPEESGNGGEEGSSGGSSDSTKSETESATSSEEDSKSTDSGGNSSRDGSNSGSSSADETGDANEGSNTGNESSGDLEESSNESQTAEEASYATGSSTFFKELATMDIREEGWFVLKDLSNIQLEDGFVIREIEYEGEMVDSAFHEIKGITLLYFTDITGDTIRKLIYIEEQDEMYPYVTMRQGILYTFLPGVPEEGLPEGYEENQLVVNGQVLTAWQQQEGTKADFYLVYAVNEQGERGLYQYDQMEKTLQRFIPEQKEAAPEEEWEEPGFSQVLQQNRMIQGTFISLSILILIMTGSTAMLGYKLNKEEKKKAKRIGTK